MPTKEEILSGHLGVYLLKISDISHGTEVVQVCIERAMDEYAKQECIAVLDFLNEKLTLEDGNYFIEKELVAYPHETELLYKLYLQSKQP